VVEREDRCLDSRLGKWGQWENLVGCFNNVLGDMHCQKHATAVPKWVEIATETYEEAS
jgi:hypothetical protein